MDGEALLSLIKAQTVSASCEITCLTVPTPVNQSMYRDDNARNKDYLLNTRATALMWACGHAFPADISNEDVFIGRCLIMKWMIFTLQMRNLSFWIGV